MAKNTKKWALGALLAGLGGYVAGILTAPKSGKETRKDIGQAANKAKADAERTLKQLHSDLDILIEKGRQQAKNMQTAAKEQLTKLLDNAQKAKEKARVLLSALHEGDTDDKDLKKAINEVNQALEHLKDYLKKEGTTTK